MKQKILSLNEIIEIIKSTMDHSNSFTYNIRDKGNTFTFKVVGGNVSEKPPKWFAEWSDNVFITVIKEIKSDISELKADIKLIKSLPTIRKEIAEIENK